MAFKTVFDFFESPLVAWAKSILLDDNECDDTTTNNNICESSLNYDLFTNGEYFYRMLKRIDSRFEILHLPNETCGGNDDKRLRLENLDYLMRNIKSFYRVRLLYLVILRFKSDFDR